MILEKTLKLVQEKLADQYNHITIEAVCVGLHLTAVRLSDGSCGVASTLVNTNGHCAKKDRNFGAFSPAKIQGQKIQQLFEGSKSNNITETLKIAVFNALSSKFIAQGDYNILEDADPIQLIDFEFPKRITMIGAFSSYIQKISQTNSSLRVLELNEDALMPEHKKFYVPAEGFKQILPESDVVIITGLTLVNNTIDGLLNAVSPDAFVIVTGPSSSLLPDVLFNHHVDVVGGMRILDAEALFSVASEGGAGYHLFKYCSQKICILNDGNYKIKT